MLPRLVALAFVLLCARDGATQTLPVIRSHSRVVTITDGRHVKKHYWFVMPERAPDVYYVEIPRQPHTVTFTTDVESISFDVTFGSRHDFIIRLDDGREARTQVRTEFKHQLSCSPPMAGAAVIPFTLGDNDKIYVDGRVNAQPALKFQFDLGSGGSLIKKSSVAKANLTFDGSIQLRNSDGVNTVPSSSANQLELVGWRCDGIPFAVADNMTHREDGLIGNALFQDKVVEIDYDRMAIVIHETAPVLTAPWIKADMILDGVVPFVPGTLALDGAASEGWFLLDTGAYTSILNHERLSPVTKMLRELRGLTGSRTGPVLSVGGQTFTDINYSARTYDGDPTSLGLLGNDVLKRFNLVVDNRRGMVFFRPNAHRGDSFRNPDYIVVRAAAVAAVGMFAATVWMMRRRKRR
jgi:hypothetical protein